MTAGRDQPGLGRLAEPARRAQPAGPQVDGERDERLAGVEQVEVAALDRGLALQLPRPPGGHAHEGAAVLDDLDSPHGPRRAPPRCGPASAPALPAGRAPRPRRGTRRAPRGAAGRISSSAVGRVLAAPNAVDPLGGLAERVRRPVEQRGAVAAERVVLARHGDDAGGPPQDVRRTRPRGRRRAPATRRRGPAPWRRVRASERAGRPTSAGHHLEEVAHDVQVGVLGERRVGIAVDGDDRLGVLHPDPVLDRPRDDRPRGRRTVGRSSPSGRPGRRTAASRRPRRPASRRRRRRARPRAPRGGPRPSGPPRPRPPATTIGASSMLAARAAASARATTRTRRDRPGRSPPSPRPSRALPPATAVTAPGGA